jgi:hypothetical protein
MGRCPNSSQIQGTIVVIVHETGEIGTEEISVTLENSVIQGTDEMTVGLIKIHVMIDARVTALQLGQWIGRTAGVNPTRSQPGKHPRSKK